MVTIPFPDKLCLLGLPGMLGAKCAGGLLATPSGKTNRSQDGPGKARIAPGFPPAQQKLYEEWTANHKVENMLFNKTTKCLVTKMLSDVREKDLKEKMFSFEIEMSLDPERLRIKSGSGDTKRLVLLRGPPVEVDALPGFCKGVASSIVEEIKQADEEEEVPCPEEFAVDSEHADELEARALEEAEKEMEEPKFEIMCFTDEEEEVKEIAGPTVTRVKSFMHRKAFKVLEGYGVTLLPPKTHIGYHSTTRTWQGYFEGSSKDLSFTHGGTTNRSEAEALLRVVRGLLSKHCAKFPHDKLWKQQLEKTEAIEAKMASL